ncbi:hypothetical protein BJ912DRAFT_1026998 [Pholiota molesta]|nr:hypothetical protein BJ912DRAFT_1026998 [Pholiota molesta]
MAKRKDDGADGISPPPQSQPSTKRRRPTTSRAGADVPRPTRASRVTTIAIPRQGPGRLLGSHKLQTRTRTPDSTFGAPLDTSQSDRASFLYAAFDAPDFGESSHFNADTAVLDDNSKSVASKAKRSRDNNTQSKLHQWLAFRSDTLDELLRHDGLGGSLEDDSCTICKNVVGMVRCKDCFGGGRLRCNVCMVQTHREAPLHRVERWTGQFFRKETLQALGLRIQLGHGGESCPCPSSGPPNFMVFDMSGIHPISIDYCSCPIDNLPDRQTQLLRAGWFPATFSRPNTAFTFDCLNTFHEHTLQGKGNLYDFYYLLTRKTDNAGVWGGHSIDRYKELSRAFRIWRNLMALKRAGRATIQPAALIVECPACPHPGRNLPQTGLWQGPFYVELMPGWGVYVEELAYQKFLSNYVDHPEVNDCESEHDALAKAATRGIPGYASSGNGIAICSRHGLVRSAGDLQKGEKYCNMDYIILTALIGIALPRVLITYDIACQWSKNFRSRMQAFPEHMRIPPETKIDVAIPSWHINGHGQKCRDGTCGEEVEISWSHANPLVPSVKEMGPAARHDTLNDHWNGWNFRKIVGFKAFLARRFEEATAMSAKQQTVFQQFSSSLPAMTTKKWERMIELWENNPKAPNPIQIMSEVTTTLNDVRLELAKEEGFRIASGHTPQHEVTMLGFFNIGFDIEDQQFALKKEITERNPTSKLAELEEKKTSLIRQIQSWQLVQMAYIPCTASIIQTNGENRYANPESMALRFPSSLPPEARALPELKEICEMERRLREPQADDALADIRRQRRIIQGLWDFKKLNVSGTGNRPNTKLFDLYTRINQKLQRAAHRYHIAYHALSKLDPNGAWVERLKELHPKDIRGPGRDPDNADDTQSSKGRYEPSWIWLVQRSPRERVDENQSEEEFNETLRVEWAQIRARGIRWKEEELIVREEMRRVLSFLEWKAAWWEEQADQRQFTDSKLESGVAAYAFKQAFICKQMAEGCGTHWMHIFQKYGSIPLWGKPYLVVSDGENLEVPSPLNSDME